jgi:sulfide:quinone oxidoreductase
LTADFAVAEQITADDLVDLAQAGFRTVISNRPDGEVVGQPLAADLAAEAERHGLAYRHLPVKSGCITAADVEALVDVLGTLSGPFLAFCRSGTRSTVLWALAEAPRLGVERVVQCAAAAGYELEPLRPRLEACAGAGSMAGEQGRDDA